ncbi:hypothetical protein [Tuwongella immobilis]|uniref:DUF4149 domain-containing protein n=1 Tax=Tuwongella immobilis TaxID=692036 RepID=A0A6C2YHX1_9BACT|nr:hypothetical protein [Tuwongella immobilis]VIP00964.1 Uncharacterized protein OS=Singulisphaera acidiphila (strain ATCC BAA-1392 / DSM 18658 / VKM B-2454 / MOB10) GN=Sinac_4368 PE=4 SV=1 [Tuwongella immobilis]VTR97346.1 Uncharacterized protein OS=Singulisphaera acidiphila (strain ATCC BAA-1392 / DSM 18658 / VKM B-2454 / MOB10) GN=Sinac_4368 PE=4 SV=1 [Tuwongella immobilis]
MLARRLGMLTLLSYWQGGFLFYGTVVVAVGADVLGSDREQGFITRQVAWYLNIIGFGVLTLLAVDLWRGAEYRRPVNSGRRRILWLLWGIQLVNVSALAGIHPHMDALLDAETHEILARPEFRGWHRWYLRIWTILWLTHLVDVGYRLQAWRAADGEPGPQSPSPSDAR